MQGPNSLVSLYACAHAVTLLELERKGEVRGAEAVTVKACRDVATRRTRKLRANHVFSCARLMARVALFISPHLITTCRWLV